MADGNQIRYYGTGKRKNAVARVWISPGTGQVVINDRPAPKYLGRAVLERLIHQPFAVTDREGRFDVIARCHGGGISGQAGAIRHGISKALLEADPDLRPVLRRLGLLTRDPRVKERKKYGRKRARRGFQFSKR
ncbi:MAG TPA: 30S ribosomal protein S9 [Chthonomonadaceae bacterium]|nr:30S ribosomal protein S9 [Chthonomonadaceae bacterium]